MPLDTRISTDGGIQNCILDFKKMFFKKVLTGMFTIIAVKEIAFSLAVLYLITEIFTGQCQQCDSRLVKSGQRFLVISSQRLTAGGYRNNVLLDFLSNAMNQAKFAYTALLKMILALDLVSNYLAST